MNIPEFVAKWRRVELTERSASQQHFLDLCAVFEHPTPAEVDPTGEWFTFERGAEKHSGSRGWADVWKKGNFAFEYKGKHKNLDAAYDQLLQYREALESPPLLIVCDMERLVVHTNFTATVAEVHDIALVDFNRPRNVEILRAIFEDPERLRPGVTSKTITTEVARQVGDVAQGLRERGFDAGEVARFLDRIVFCLFAEDVGLLPERLFTRLVEKSGRDPQRFSKTIGRLFDAMREGSDDFGLETIAHFNGNLFTDSPVLALTPDEIESLDRAARLDWKAVDPAIFGTLFERGLDPAKRAQLGAQYTSREDIETLIEPVVLRPLREEWEGVKGRANELLADDEERERKRRAEVRDAERFLLREATDKSFAEAQTLVRGFHERLAALRVLDPACGSGNFLYVTLQHLKDLEKEVLLYARDRRLGNLPPRVSPLQFYGIEVNPYAFDLAQTTLWIGYLQWIRANGYGTPAEPILRSLENNFRNTDAILDLSDAEHPKEPEWPAVDFIVGNPPFLGDKKMRRELGDDYVEALRKLYKGRVPGGADLVTYWFEKARGAISKGRCNRAGLVATQGIRGGRNQEVLSHIKETGNIFFAVSDKNWVLNGATVHISIVGFDDGTESGCILDGKRVDEIYANLRADIDVTNTSQLQENFGIAFQGPVRVGDFDVSFDEALAMLVLPNPNGLPNSDVLRPSLNGDDNASRSRHRWVIDFTNLSLEVASLYEAPFQIIENVVRPFREKSRDKARREKWWLHGRTGSEFRGAVLNLNRYLALTQTAKHLMWQWQNAIVSPEQTIIAVARDDDYFFGVLHSRVHVIWAQAKGTQLREKESGFRYTPTTCFETFPFPEPTPAQRDAIADAARGLDELRRAWLNPPEWTRAEVLE
ncbi:MAG: DNA methyltransferase, partial [Pyrinomonadaceae bacterium]